MDSSFTKPMKLHSFDSYQPLILEMHQYRNHVKSPFLASYTGFALQLVSFLILLFFAQTLYGQVHSIPENGAKGIPGTVPNSFIIGWKPFEDAIGYEYVMSDNPLCFVGCAGDTRQAMTTDTLAQEFNLQEDTWYYWITRIIHAPGDTSHWSLISSFFAENPSGSDAKMLSIAPNPVIYPTLNLRLDWAQNPEANTVEGFIYDQNGNIRKEISFNRLFGVRFEEVNISIEELPAGMYILQARVNGNQNNLNNLFTIKMIVL